MPPQLEEKGSSRDTSPRVPGAKMTVVQSDALLPYHVLIAEDHEPTRETLSLLLEKKAYRVTAVEDGEQAVGKLTGIGAPCIAVLDWGLPDMSGIDVCRAVRKQGLPHYTYIIIVTARDGKDDVAEALAAGADDFIRKPYVLQELIARVRSGQRVIELERNLASRIKDLEEALGRVNQLKRLLPICMFCKKIRDDQDYWKEIESYLHEQTGTDFSHGICPHCMEVHYKELALPAAEDEKGPDPSTS
jgi:phosphoserine phosphatase RsbU/P